MGEFELKKEAACELGRDKGKYAGQTLVEIKGKDLSSKDIGQSFDHWTSSAGYANYILPKLRKISGYEDTGGGTYTKVPEGKERVDLAVKMDEIIDEFRRGFFEAAQKIAEKKLDKEVV